MQAKQAVNANWKAASDGDRKTQGLNIEMKSTNRVVNALLLLLAYFFKVKATALVTCEGSTATLQCSFGDAIYISSAEYGRRDRGTCPHSAIKTTNCEASSSLQVVRNACQGKRSCSIAASNSNFGDPCWGTYKYLSVTYYCNNSGRSSINIAQGKPTRQSSTAFGGFPSRAVDGDRNTDWGGSSCTHTNQQFGPWWRVDLQKIYDVGEVKITNRGDCCSNRLRQIEVRVGFVDYNPAANGLCKYYSATAGRGQTLSLLCTNSIAGRFVYVALRLREYLTLCEVEVYEAVRGRSNTNIAQGKPTRQSSTAYGGFPSRAVDGNRNTNWGGSSCTHTGRQFRPWWRVDLQSSYDVSEVKLTNRGDCCSNRLRQIEVRVGLVDNNPAANTLFKYYSAAVGSGQTLSLASTNSIAGRFVYVTLRVTEYLTLCELEVYGTVRESTGDNIARGKPTRQSSAAYGGFPSRAVDGDRNTNWGGSSCTHTGRQYRPWWRVDLQNIYDVSGVRITNRGDCCSNRLRQVEVRVGMVDDNPGANTLCKYHAGAIASGQTVELSCSDAIAGRYVYVTLRVTGYLTLCEVEVLEAKDKTQTTCEGGRSKIECPYGESILIESAEYGRNDRYTCPHSSIRTTNCRAAGSLQVVKAACEGKRSCSIPATNGEFGDPCIGTYKYLHVKYSCKKQVYSYENIAHWKSTRQSSTAYGGLSSRAVDGNKNTYWGGSSCTHTSRQFRPWWRVDLQKNYDVSEVKITNRGDCCSNRLREIEIRVGYVDDNPAANALCTYYAGTIGSGKTAVLLCSRLVTGRYVYVSLRVREYLTLCEVEVFEGKAVAYDNGNVATGKPSKQSSTGYGGVPSRAVDGNNNSNWRGYSCTHTKRQKNPWWRVDLQAIHNVNKVKITNRGDCCSNRLRRLEVRVGMTDNKPGANSMCKYYPGAVGKGKTIELTCSNPVAGRYVFIRLKVKEYLTLCEVEVYAVKANTEATCEGGVSRLSCPRGQQIYVSNAEYGRKNRQTCPSTSIRTTSCKASTSLHVVRRACHGKRSCSVPATNGRFGDPCVGTYKYLSITYLCYKPGASSGRSKHGKTRKGLAVGLGISCACLFIVLCVLRPKILKKWHEGNFRIACNRTNVLRASNTAKPAILVNEGIGVTASNAARTTTDSRGQGTTSSSNTTVTASEGGGSDIAPISVISYSDAPPAYADALKYASSLQPSNSTGFATLEEGPPPYSTLDSPEHGPATLLDPNMVALRITARGHSPPPDATTDRATGVLPMVEDTRSSHA